MGKPSLFQVLTGESWSEAIARPLIFGLYNNSITAAAYFVSFIFLCSFLMLNLFVAVIYDAFMKHMQGSAEQDGLVDESPAQVAIGRCTRRLSEISPEEIARADRKSVV